MYLILQQDEPDDYVISTGITTSIRDFIKLTAEKLGMEITFTGKVLMKKVIITDIDKKMFSEIVGSQYIDRYVKNGFAVKNRKYKINTHRFGRS